MKLCVTSPIYTHIDICKTRMSNLFTLSNVQSTIFSGHGNSNLVFIQGQIETFKMSYDI